MMEQSAMFPLTPEGVSCLPCLDPKAPMLAYALPGHGALTLAVSWHAGPFPGCHGSEPMLSESTSRDDYMRGARQEIARLKALGGKTVYSRVIAGHCRRKLHEAIADYLAGHPGTFRFVMAPCPGQLWVGASPELLVDNNPTTRRLDTCALAGTRPAGTTGPWDHKNISEHEMVVEFITDTLTRAGLNPIAGPRGSMRFGAVDHLHTPLQADWCADCRTLLGSLSPTPAMAGLPRNRAIDHIALIEQHRRCYYGGYVAVDTAPGHTVAYVNLRSMRVAPLPDGTFLYNIYVGGGLTAESIPDDEWTETCLKASTMLKALDTTLPNR